MLTKKDVQNMLPKVGDKMRKKPTLLRAGGQAEERPAQDCVVVEVNREHLWYRVRFESGAHECYKVPEDKLGPQGGLIR